MSFPAVTGKCGAYDIMQLYPSAQWNLLLKRAGLWLSAGSCSALMNEKTLSLLFPVGVAGGQLLQMTGALLYCMENNGLVGRNVFFFFKLKQQKCTYLCL